MRKGWDIEMKVGVFIVLGLVLVLVSILVLGSNDNFFTRKNHYTAHFSDVEGLIPGAKVVMGGVQVGTVSDVSFDTAHRDIQVTFDVARAQADWVRKDSTVQIMTQGVLGDKYLEVTRGSDDSPVLAAGSDIPLGTAGGLTQFLSKSDQLLASLQSIAGSVDRLLKTFEYGHRSEIFFDGMAKTAHNLSLASAHLNEEINDVHLKTASKNFNSILQKINDGTGTLGALVNDPGLYDDVKALMGGANRNRVMRNLVRQTIRKNEEDEATPPPREAPEPKK
jgi:phospholipid/cholesterol/gamma-HCH transport system substrate-binding protein